VNASTATCSGKARALPDRVEGVNDIGGRRSDMTTAPNL